MYRKSRPQDDMLAELMLERDHAKIQFSLLNDESTADANELALLQSKVAQLEALIEERQRTI
jgi:hypothetical protein